jgi:hypothetical protein
MPHRVARSAVVGLFLAAPFLSTTAGASTPNALSVMTKALSDGAHESSVTLIGTFSGSGITASIAGGFSPVGNGGLSAESGVGSLDIVTPVGKNYSFVKASSLAILSSALDVKSPTANEVGVWYRLPSSDSRYAGIVSPGGAQTVAQIFSFSSIGWKHSASYSGTVVLHGVRVIKLVSASNMFVTGAGFGKTTLYVTDSSKPLPFAVSGPPGSSGVAYFSKWDSTTVEIPTATSDLPH